MTAPESSWGPSRVLAWLPLGWLLLAATYVGDARAGDGRALVSVVLTSSAALLWAWYFVHRRITATDDGLTVDRGPFRSRRVTWSQVAEVTTRSERQGSPVLVRLHDGSTLRTTVPRVQAEGLLALARDRVGHLPSPAPQP